MPFDALDVHLSLVGPEEIAAAAHGMESVSPGARRQNQSYLAYAGPGSL